MRDLAVTASYIEVEFCHSQIIVHFIQKEISTENRNDIELTALLDREERQSFCIPVDELCSTDSVYKDLLTAAGVFSEKLEEISYVFDVASLFSGAGMLDYPFSKDPDFNLRFACDMEASACETYRCNIGSHIIQKDIRQIMPEEIPEIDLILSGVCCQGFSNANRHNIDSETAAKKRDLVDEHIRIVKAKKPKVFVIENVPQFISKENGRYLEKVLSGLSEYQITYQIVEDDAVGGYTTRKRMILIGSAIGKIHIPDVQLKRTRTTGEALSKVNPEWSNYKDVTVPKAETARKMAMVPPGGNYRNIPEMAHLTRHSDTYKRLDANKPAVSLPNWRKVNIMPPEGNRILTVSEASALMGLDKQFRFHGNLDQKQQQCGNGVTQAIAHFIKYLVKNALLKYANSVFESYEIPNLGEVSYGI